MLLIFTHLFLTVLNIHPAPKNAPNPINNSVENVDIIKTIYQDSKNNQLSAGDKMAHDLIKRDHMIKKLECKNGVLFLKMVSLLQAPLSFLGINIKRTALSIGRMWYLCKKTHTIIQAGNAAYTFWLENPFINILISS